VTSLPRRQHMVTPLQFAFLTVLTEKPLTGKQMRAELAENGVHKTADAFFRVMQRLKQENLVSARSIARDEGEYRGAQSVYELTQTGKDALALMLGLYRRAGRRVRRLRWGGKRRSILPSLHSGSRASRHLPPRTVVRERAEGSQVTELLTNVRSGRRRLALLRVVTIYTATAYNATAALGAASNCQNGIDSKLQPHDSRLRVVDRTLQVHDSKSPIVDSKFRFLKFEISNCRIETSRRRFEVSNRQLGISNRRFEMLNRQNEVSISEIRSFKSAIRNFKSTIPSLESIAPIVGTPLWSSRLARRRRLRRSRAREPPAESLTTTVATNAGRS